MYLHDAMTHYTVISVLSHTDLFTTNIIYTGLSSSKYFMVKICKNFGEEMKRNDNHFIVCAFSVFCRVLLEICSFVFYYLLAKFSESVLGSDIFVSLSNSAAADKPSVHNMAVHFSPTCSSWCVVLKTFILCKLFSVVEQLLLPHPPVKVTHKIRITYRHFLNITQIHIKGFFSSNVQDLSWQRQ